MNIFFRTKAKMGFTLIELLVVIAIIGVLASIVLASLNTARRKSRDARRLTDIKQLQLALELYFDGIGSGQYPLASTGAVSCTGAIQYGLEALSAGNYIPQVPRDPTGVAPNNCYKYATHATLARTTYHLGVTLADGLNTALTGDRDAAVTAGWTNDFSGLADNTEGVECDTTAGIPAPGGETCYDIIP